MQLTAPAYMRFRGYLRRQQAIRPLVVQARHLMLVGPLRPAIVAYHRAVTRPTPIRTNTLPHIEPFDVEKAAQAMHRNGYSPGIRVTPACVDKLLQCYETKPVQSYNDPHRDHDFIAELTRNEYLVKVARLYLRSEPIFLESRLHCYTPGKSGNPDHFHYDVGDALTITFFVFLTDVMDHQSVIHQVVAGTHRSKTPRELWTHKLYDTDARNRYGDRVHTVMGPRGTAWFLDTLAFHKHGYVGKVRKCFSVSYALHRQR